MEMSHSEASVVIHASPEAVLNFIVDPYNSLKFFPTLKTIENVHRVPDEVGTTYDWTFVVWDEEVRGTNRVTEYIKGERYSFNVHGTNVSDYDGVYTFMVTPRNSGCELTMSVDYHIPSTIIDSIMKQARALKLENVEHFERLNDAQNKITMNILKTILEG